MSEGVNNPTGQPPQFGTIAARPAAAANPNMIYMATDTGELALSNGAFWNAIGSTSSPVGLDIRTAGAGVRVAEGANCKQGLTAAMVAGTLLIANTSVTATSRIQLTRQDGGTNPGAVYVSARVAGTSFTIASTNAADTGQVAYEIFEPG